MVPTKYEQFDLGILLIVYKLDESITIKGMDTAPHNIAELYAKHSSKLRSLYIPLKELLLSSIR